MVLDPASSQFWQGRHDGANAKRIHEAVQLVDLSDLSQILMLDGFGFLGFACDEGVRRNSGRCGAKEGPDALRKCLAGLPVPSNSSILYDFGTILCHDQDLESAQQSLATAVTTLIKRKVTPIVLGGGHEVAWGHYQGIAAAFPNAAITIINLDAHFDLRPLLPNNQGHSGSSFRQIADFCQREQKPFNYACFGIQQSGNTADLFDYAKALDVTVVTAEEFHLTPEKPLSVIDALIRKSEIIYLTLCLDVFAAAFAPGVSAPQPLGLFPWQVIPLLQHLAESGKVIGLDVAELCPQYDKDDLTARLAAGLVYHFLKEGNACWCRFQ